MKKKRLLLPNEKKELLLLSDSPCKADAANGAIPVQNQCHREKMSFLKEKTGVAL